jgi:hypothetical protein
VISRRRFVAGAGAAAAVVLTDGAGFVAAGPNRVLRRLGLRDSPDHRVPPSGRSVVERAIASDAMHRGVTWAYVVPDAAPAATVVCLHGRGASHRVACDAAALPRLNLGGFSHGCHDDPYRRIIAPDQIRTIMAAVERG